MCARRRNSIERKAPQRARECAHRNHTQRGEGCCLGPTAFRNLCVFYSSIIPLFATEELIHA